MVTVKVGTALQIPVGNTGITVTSSDPLIIKVSTGPGQVVGLTALKPGQVTLTAALASDLSVSLTVNVVG